MFHQRYGAHVFIFSYRGYGLSEGSANEQGLKQDTQAVLEFLANHPITSQQKWIAYGQSLGGAVAIYALSQAQTKFQGLIVENTFINIASYLLLIIINSLL